MEEKIKRLALLNAVKFNGKSNPGAVIGHLLAEDNNLKEKIKEVSKKVNAIIKEVNALGLDKQKQLIEELGIVEEKKEKKEKNIFGFVEIKGPVVTAFPPEPSKYPHIGHAKAILVNYEFARRNNGKFILRFEDTNPLLAKEEFYKIHLDNYEWLGIKVDELQYASDHMEKFYESARKLIKQGDAYICICPQEKMKKSRMEGTECECRNSKKHSFDDLLNAKEGEMVLRLKIGMQHNNSAMRDPTVMRIIEAPHPRKGSKYGLWPNYDFENSIMDGAGGITHRFRSKEFEMRNELQRYIQKKLGFNETSIYEFARFNLEGVESSGRVIREKIEKKEFIGWDDPRLTTLVALRRRGFQPEAIRNFVLSTGITKAEATLTWDDLIVHNRRLLDKEAKRFFFIENEVEIKIKGAPEQSVKIRIHPESPEMGTRKLDVKEDFIIEKHDFDKIENNKVYRLMDCLNFEKRGDGFHFHSLDYETFKNNKTMIIHWLPKDGNTKAKVLLPDARWIKGSAEKNLSAVKEGEVIQFERFGFARLDSKKDLSFWFTHE
ncbi:glutamate--tRNA ligase [Candidatus Woesearchaeota archaeon]|nr:glutamate--tRNA ligase [Candidatus Woesearchaeota archaeon]